MPSSWIPYQEKRKRKQKPKKSISHGIITIKTDWLVVK
ncbi:Uncharacterised protein [Vibrio cholerae]|nr:Uncharacterised protein [Vibrio cholerae]